MCEEGLPSLALPVVDAEADRIGRLTDLEDGGKDGLDPVAAVPMCGSDVLLVIAVKPEYFLDGF